MLFTGMIHQCLLQECQGSPVEEILVFLSSTNENEYEVEKPFDFALPTDDPFIGASPAQSPPLLPTSPLSSLPAVPAQEEVKTVPLHYSDSSYTIWKK